MRCHSARPSCHCCHWRPCGASPVSGDMESKSNATPDYLQPQLNRQDCTKTVSECKWPLRKIGRSLIAVRFQRWQRSPGGENGAKNAVVAAAAHKGSGFNGSISPLTDMTPNTVISRWRRALFYITGRHGTILLHDGKCIHSSRSGFRGRLQKCTRVHTAPC